jgi:hypothetical protein
MYALWRNITERLIKLLSAELCERKGHRMGEKD